MDSAAVCKRHTPSTRSFTFFNLFYTTEYGNIVSVWLQVISTDMMASSSSMKQNTNIIGEAELLQQLEHSSILSWRTYRKRGFIRHVGIIIFLDGTPFCTVDFEVENPGLSCLVACPSKVFLKRVSPEFENRVGYLSADIQCLCTRHENCKRNAAQKIHDLVTPNHNIYSLLLNNCRDNTRDAVGRVCDSGQCIEENLRDSSQMIQKTKLEDLFWYIATGITLLGIALFCKPRPQQ